MEDLSLHILDIAENSIRAGATRVAIEIVEDEKSDVLSVCISDDGKGMNDEEVKRAFDPFFTTKQGKRVGLGLAFLSQAGEEAGGGVTVDSAPGRGTCVKATFNLSHPDIKPMGNIVETMATLMAGHPEIRFVFDITQGDYSRHFDSHENKANRQ
jgi:signal transduction histidine kinase